MQEKPDSALKQRRTLRWGVVLPLTVFGVGAVWILLALGLPRINTLPPDEELIAHFYQHRADIEELVTRYRNYVPPPGEHHGAWERLGDTPELFARTGVKYLKEIGPTWLPDPYSQEARQQDRGIVTDYREAAKYRTVAIVPSDEDFHHNVVWKDIVFMPVMPRLEHGELVGPIDHLGRHTRYRLFPALDNEPPDVKRDTCAFRQIESQWFVRMCRVLR